MTRSGRPLFLLGALIFLAHGYFWNGIAWNQAARLGGIFAFVEPGTADSGTFRIDRFREAPERGLATKDWARVGGHYYPNKAPGTTFLGIPAYAVLFRAERALGLDPQSARSTNVNGYAINLWVSALWTAVAAAALWAAARGLATNGRGGESSSADRPAIFGALLAALTYAFGTMAFPFDTTLWGHTTAAAFAALGLCALLRSREFSSFAAGFWNGMAVLTDYLAAVSWLAGLAASSWPDPRSGRGTRARLRPALLYLAGSAAPLAALAAYHQVCFGKILTTATALQNPGFQQSGRVAGAFGLPSLAVIGALLASSHRGLFVSSPVLVFAVPGAIRLWRSGSRRLVLICAANIAGYLLAVASFNGWHGGDSTGPRYLIGSLPFWCLLLAPVASRAASTPRRAGSALFVGALLLSAANMLVVTFVHPMMSSDVPNPLYGILYPALFAGRLPARVQVFNLGGVLFELRGRAALIPWVVLVGGMLAILVAWTRRVSPAVEGEEERGG